MGAFIRIVLVTVGHIVRRLKIFAPELVDVKSALIYVKIDIAFFKIRCASLPDLRFGVQRLNLKPSSVADAFGVLFGGDKQNFQMIVICLIVDFENDTADFLKRFLYRYFPVRFDFRILPQRQKLQKLPRVDVLCRLRP